MIIIQGLGDTVRRRNFTAVSLCPRIREFAGAAVVVGLPVGGCPKCGTPVGAVGETADACMLGKLMD